MNRYSELRARAVEFVAEWVQWGAPVLVRAPVREAADVVILTCEGLDEMVGEGRVVANSCVDLARSYVGLAVKAGAPHPGVATEPALRAALLGARSVAYSRIGASGILFAQLIERHCVEP